MPIVKEDEDNKITRLFVPKYTGGPRPKMVLFQVWPWKVYGRFSAWEQAQKKLRDLAPKPKKD